VGSIKTNILFSEFAPSNMAACLNIYGILYQNDLFVNAIEANLSLEVVKQKFVAQMLKKQIDAMPGHVPQKVKNSLKNQIGGRRKVIVDERGRKFVENEGGQIRAALQVLYDRKTGYLHVVNSSFSSAVRSNNIEGKLQHLLLSGIIRWVSREYDRKVEDMSVVSGPIPFQDYEIHYLSEFPGVYSTAERVGVKIDPEEDIRLLLVNFGNQDMKRMVEDQLGTSDVPTISLTDAFRYEEGDREVIRVNPPFVLVNSQNKNYPTILKEVLSAMVREGAETALAQSTDEPEKAKEVGLEYLQDVARIRRDGGLEFADQMYNSILQYLDACPVPETEWIRHAMEKFGIESGDDPQLANFFKTFLLYRGMHDPARDRDVYEQLFYYFVKLGEDGGIENEKLFEQLFSVVDRRGLPSGGMALTLASYYSLPAEVLSFFGFSDVADQKIFNTNTRVLSSSTTYAARELQGRGSRDPEMRAEIPELEHDLATGLGQQYGNDIDNRVHEPIMVRSLASFPMAYAEVQQMFRDRGVPFRDIRIVLAYETQNPGILGGYSPMNPDAERQALELGRFPPPVIVLNIYNRKLRNIDNIAEVLIHECSHFIDDLMIQQGLAEQSRMFNPERPRGGLDDMIRYLREYLGKSPTEFDAHAMMPYAHLKLMDAEYLRENRYALKKRLLATLFIGEDRYVVPLNGDAAAGDDLLSIDVLQVGDLLQQQVDVVDRDRNPSAYFGTGVKGYETVQIVGLHPDKGDVRISPPLASPFYVADGAAISSPPSDPVELREEREVLYSRIIDHAFDLALDKSLPEGQQN